MVRADCERPSLLQKLQYVEKVACADSNYFTPRLEADQIASILVYLSLIHENKIPTLGAEDKSGVDEIEKCVKKLQDSFAVHASQVLNKAYIDDIRSSSLSEQLSTMSCFVQFIDEWNLSDMVNAPRAQTFLSRKMLPLLDALLTFPKSREVSCDSTLADTNQFSADLSLAEKETFESILEKLKKACETRAEVHDNMDAESPTYLPTELVFGDLFLIYY